jgi:hypothetical protein
MKTPSGFILASDKPAADWLNTVKAVRERKDLSDKTKQMMVHDNVVRFYKQAR